MWIAVNSQGQVVYRTPYQTLNNARWWPPQDQALACVLGALGGAAGDYRLHLVQDDAQARALGDAPLDSLVAQMADGQVVGVEVAAPAPGLWLYGALTGGTINALTGTRYVQRGDQLTYAASLHASPDPTSPVLAQVPGADPPVPLSGAWALEMPHEDGIDLFSPYVELAGGQASGGMVIPDRLCDGLYALSEKRMAMIGPFKVRLGEPGAWAFKVRS